jgi:outer membrane protein assembly factor BamB
MPNPSVKTASRRVISPKGCAFALTGVALLALIAWGIRIGIDSLTPHITSIPLMQPGGTTAEIDGVNFGAQPGSIWLEPSSENGTSRQVLPVLAWRNEQITLRLPAGVTRGSLQVERQTLIGSRSSQPHDFLTQRKATDGAATFTAPTQPGSPWPTFRRDIQNTGRSPLPVQYAGDSPWTFKTGKGLFVTPVIDAGGNIYVGSADHYFYALGPDGRLKWKCETGEIIDSAGALFDATPGSGEAPLVFISGDGNMYGFRLDETIANASDRLLWKYQAQLRPGVSFNRWFEGNVAVGPDGALYAGNTNFLYYAISPTGQLKWTYPTDSNNWSLAAFGRDGSIYWGSNDTFIRGVSPSGQELWKTRTLGFIAASAAVGSDDTVYIGSFDSNLYALDPASGAVRWKFPTLDHIYASAALGMDSAGKTNAIYVGSADGSLYAIRPDGRPIWRYDTGDPIRSSPAVGLAPGSPQGQPAGEVVYFGSGNGILYALNAADGSLRWSYDTTSADPELQDRNDLNGSPALGKTGIYIGSEDGDLVYVPYDYCLHAANPRCSTTHSDLSGRLSQDSAAPGAVNLFYVTPGGSTLADFPPTLSPAAMITLRLVSIKDGQTQNAFVCNNPLGCPKDDLQVSFTPSIPFQVDHSADGRYLYIRPAGFLTPDTEYQLHVSGRVYSGGVRLGNLTLFGSPAGRFESKFAFRTEITPDPLPLQVNANATSALEWSRLAAPLPPMLPSLNQIGFDYMDWILGTVLITPADQHNQGKVILWAVGAKRGADGKLEVDPQSPIALPLSGSYQGDAFILANQNFKMSITGIDIPFNRLELRGRLGQDGIVQPGASAFADTQALAIPKFGPYLVVAGLANNIYQKLLVAGTYITRPYPAEASASRRPDGITVADVHYQAPDDHHDGLVSAGFKLAAGAAYPLDQHRPALLLIDSDRGEAIFLDYQALLKPEADAAGNLAGVSLRLPAGTKLPEHIQAAILLDVFPMAVEKLAP